MFRIKSTQKIALILIGIFFVFGFTLAWNTDRADIIYNYLDKKYQSLTIDQQEDERWKMKSLFYQIQRKTDNEDLISLVDILIFKAERKINALQEYKEKYPHWNDDLSNLDQLRYEMLDQLNQERSSRGLPSLALNIKLNSSAQLHAEYMAQTDDFAHTTKWWLSFDQRIKNAWYNGRTMWENIAWNQRTVSQVMDSWMNSDWHRANILNSQFTEIGIGFSDYYRVQSFWW